MITISREAYDVVVAMKLGLGSVRIAKGLGISHAAVLSRQNTLEKLGVISKGATPEPGVRGEARKVLLADGDYRVEPEHRGTVLARAAADRADAAKREERLANLAKARAAKAAKRSPVEEPVPADDLAAV